MPWRLIIVFLVCFFTVVCTFDTVTCPHCPTEYAYEEFLKPESTAAGSHTDVHVLWSTHIELVHITEDAGGWEPPSFHEKLAAEAIRGWRRFRDDIAPNLQKDHPLREEMSETHAGALNDAFFKWQKKLFEVEGNITESLSMKDHEAPSGNPPPDAPSSWPEMNDLPEYRKLRKIVEKLSRRYLARSGMHPDMAAGLNYSLFNWAAIHGPGEFHGPHTHIGEYHVGVFYAQAGPAAGKLRFGDPRGGSPPFGRSFWHTPKSGDLIIFPSWLNHMATVTAPASDILNEEEEPYRVVFSFNIGPVSGPLPCHFFWSDPTADMRFKRRSKLDMDEMRAL